MLMRLVFSAAILVAPALVGATALGQDADSAQQRADYIRSHYSKFEHRIPMRDGKRLFTFTQANSSFFRNTPNNNSLLCFDVIITQ